jgi:uncharacterized damage-inducible protein DinB
MAPRDDSAIHAQLEAERANLIGNSTVLAYARTFFDDPVATFELVCMASNLVDDFDDYGPVIQADEDGAYSPDTSIQRLRAARDRIFAAYDSRSRLPFLWHALEVGRFPRPRTFPGGPAMSTQSLSERDGYIATFDRETATTLRLMREFPPASLDLQPSEKSGRARDILWVLTVGPLVVTRMLSSAAVDPKTMPKPPVTLPELLMAFEQAKADALAALRKTTDDDFDTVIQFPSGPGQVSNMRRGNLLWMFLYDHIQHRGQLTVYQRIAGGKVPSIYGPSGDEPWV